MPPVLIPVPTRPCDLLLRSSALPQDIIPRELSARDTSYDADAKRAIAITLGIIFGIVGPIALFSIFYCVYKRRNLPKNRPQPLSSRGGDGGDLVVIAPGTEKVPPFSYTRNRQDNNDGHMGEKDGCCAMFFVGCCGLAREKVDGREAKRRRRNNGIIGEYGPGGHIGGLNDRMQAEYQNTSIHTMETITDERTSRSPQRRTTPNRRYNRSREGYRSNKQRRGLREGRGSTPDAESATRRDRKKGRKIRRPEAGRFQLRGLTTAPRPWTPRIQSDPSLLSFAMRTRHIENSPPDPDRLQVPNTNHGRSRPRKSLRKSPSSPSPSQGSNPEISYPDRIYNPHRNKSNISIPQIFQEQGCEHEDRGGGRVHIHYPLSKNSNHGLSPPFGYAAPSVDISSPLSSVRPINFRPSLLPINNKAKNRSPRETPDISTIGTISNRVTNGDIYLNPVNNASTVDHWGSTAGDYISHEDEGQRIERTETSTYPSWGSVEPGFGLEHPGSLVDFSGRTRQPLPSRPNTVTNMNVKEAWAPVGNAHTISDSDLGNPSVLPVPNISITHPQSKDTRNSGSNNDSNTFTKVPSSYVALGSGRSSPGLDLSDFIRVRADSDNPPLSDVSDFRRACLNAGAPSSESASSADTIIYAPQLVIDSHSCAPSSSRSYISSTSTLPSSSDTQASSCTAQPSTSGQSSLDPASCISVSRPKSHQSSSESLPESYTTPVYHSAHTSLRSIQSGRSSVSFNPPSLPFLPPLDYFVISASPSPPEAPESEATTRSLSSRYSKETVRGSPILHLQSEPIYRNVNTSNTMPETALSESVFTTHPHQRANLINIPSFSSYGAAPEPTSHSHTPAYATPSISIFGPSGSPEGGSRATSRPPSRVTHEDKSRYAPMPQITITRESRIIAVPQRVTALASRGEGALQQQEMKVRPEGVANDSVDKFPGPQGDERTPMPVVSSIRSRYRATVESVVDDSDDTGGVGVI